MHMGGGVNRLRDEYLPRRDDEQGRNRGNGPTNAGAGGNSDAATGNGGI